MKTLSFIIFSLLIIASCTKISESNNSAKTSMYAFSYTNQDYNISGKATFTEIDNNNLNLLIEVSPTAEGLFHPTHLHFGKIDGEGKMALVLNPVDGKTGKSETVISKLGDDTLFNYDRLQSFDGHIKVHLGDDGPDYDIILAAVNIGNAAGTTAPEQAGDITVCQKPLNDD